MNKFIVFEGPDGCGKTTILDLVEKYFIENKINHIRTREPGGTSLGEEVREIALTSKSNISPMTEAFLMATSRSQLVDELIKPSLENSHVLTDRFVPSSLVYQGVARGIGIEVIKELNDFALKDLRPDLTLYFAIDYENSLKRKYGTARVWLLGPYIAANFKLRGKSFTHRAEQLVDAFEEDLTVHGVGSVAELYDGNPPHNPHGAISSATAVAVILRAKYLINSYKQSK